MALIRPKDFGTTRTWPATDDYLGTDSSTSGTAKILTEIIAGGYKGADIASAATTNLATATGSFVDVTGTTTITSLGTASAGQMRVVRFTGALTITHNNPALLLQGNTNIITAANDVATFVSLGSGNWICVNYRRQLWAPLAQATMSQVITGSNTQLAVSPGTLRPQENFMIAASDETTALTTGTNKVRFRMPYAFTLSDVRACVTTAPTGSVLTVDIKAGGTTVLGTLLTIDATERTSTTAATAAVISDTSLDDDQEIAIDITTVGSTVAGAGLKVTLIGNRA